jgi:hypothetical protein
VTLGWVCAVFLGVFGSAHAISELAEVVRHNWLIWPVVLMVTSWGEFLAWTTVCVGGLVLGRTLRRQNCPSKPGLVLGVVGTTGTLLARLVGNLAAWLHFHDMAGAPDSTDWMFAFGFHSVLPCALLGLCIATWLWMRRAVISPD